MSASAEPKAQCRKRRVQLNKGSHVAARCKAHQTFVIHCRFHALKVPGKGLGL
jgi:hypothetical protein